jgi:hypothetical protein
VAYGFAIRLGIRHTLRLLLRQPYSSVTRQRGYGFACVGSSYCCNEPRSLAPGGTRVARVVGAILVGLGLFLIARATELA